MRLGLWTKHKNFWLHTGTWQISPKCWSLMIVVGEVTMFTNNGGYLATNRADTNQLKHGNSITKFSGILQIWWWYPAIGHMNALRDRQLTESSGKVSKSWVVYQQTPPRNSGLTLNRFLYYWSRICRVFNDQWMSIAITIWFGAVPMSGSDEAVEFPLQQGHHGADHETLQVPAPIGPTEGKLGPVSGEPCRRQE